MSSTRAFFDWLVVSVTGVTGGGKSELCTYLYKNLPKTTRLLRQDDYFFPENSPKHIPCSDGMTHFNWDVVTALDMDKMYVDIEEIITSPPVLKEKENITYTNMTIKDQACAATSASAALKTPQVEPNSHLALRRPVLILDGFCILDDSRIRSLSEFAIFFELSREECLRRRLLRTFDPPDVAGYFDVCVWPMYELYRSRCKRQYKNQVEIMFLAGESDMDKTHNSILNQIIRAAS
ncbi:nicotinamide riboside kinase 1-like [Hyalella azteca]|uniref:Nicotinamide riboside kinase 1-like n=1 Tax=Hyalella azteca TaxID=294128 RepID=A0A8B7PKK0_HYAAZ|nr:nicotinamide riboside kinase 1-like [Hyalella azteca]